MLAAAAEGAAVGTTVETGADADIGAVVVAVTAGEPLVVLSSVTDAEDPGVGTDVWDEEDGDWSLLVAVESSTANKSSLLM